MMSDDSENDVIYIGRPFEDLIYYKKYKLLLEECESIQKNNEKLVYRIDEVKKITKRRLDQVAYLKQRLKQKHGEDWTEIPHTTNEITVAYPQNKHPRIKTEIKEERERKPSSSNNKQKKSTACEDRTCTKSKKPPKRKIPKSEKDPRAPKRPSNPFFQFCQEQRQPLMEQLVAELKPGQIEPNKQELTRQLAIKWKTLGSIAKQVYVDMYERSKEKYAVEMSEYNMKK